MHTTAAYVRGFLVTECRARQADGVLENPETPEEAINLNRLRDLTGISKSTWSRAFTGECDRRGNGEWEPTKRFYKAIAKWLGHRSHLETERRIRDAKPQRPFSDAKIGHIPYPER